MSNKILIVEDDLLIAEMLKRMLIKLGCNVCQICTSFNRTIDYLESNKDIDLVFLDINLEDDKTGVDVAVELNSKYCIPFIYLTSYSDPKTIKLASKTFPETYLTKPFNETVLFTTLTIVKQKIEAKSKCIIIKDGSKTVKVSSDELLYIKKEGNYLEVFTKSERYVVRQSIDNFVKELDDSNFIRTHRSYAVQLKNVSLIKNQEITMIGTSIPLSRQYKSKVIDLFRSLE